jgi:hypothetical protein
MLKKGTIKNFRLPPFVAWDAERETLLCVECMGAEEAGWWTTPAFPYDGLEGWLEDPNISLFLKNHQHGGEPTLKLKKQEIIH